jgi:tRNA nucleotidyltransferase (CCA-adding enzyme)
MQAFRFDEVLDALPPEHARLLERVASVAAARATALHLVGGPVRDLLLGRPLRDLDLLLEEDALALAEAVARAHPEPALEVEAHARFGTLRIRSPEASLDLARTRRESYAHPGALPEIEVGSLEEDLLRRDFACNALVLRLDAADRGRAQPVVDRVGGLEDLAEGRLRVLHSRSFHDDPTRAFRGARLAVRLGMKLERRSRTALRDALRDGAFGAVSGERYRRELVAIFEEPRQGADAGRILALLSEMHVLAALEPGLSLPRDRQAPLRRLSRSLESPEWATGRLRPWIAGVSIWLAPLPTVTRRRTLERFAIRGEQAARILRFGAEAERTLRSLAKVRGRGAVDALLGELSEESLQAIFALADVAIRRRILRWGAEDKRRRAPVVGSDLTALGITGPDVGRGLARIRAAFLDGELANREEALVLAQELARRRSRAPKRRARSVRVARSSAVAPGEAILDTAARQLRKPAKMDPDPDSNSVDGPDSPRASSPETSKGTSKKAPRTDPTR